ncbi:MAG: sigma 54-interacting transcriptional regulator, partial [Thermoanaerobaculia bacterium]|nr:sigma 54-interacting transcriptional regulator [Thermoanaerobaculia bacterium]
VAIFDPGVTVENWKKDFFAYITQRSKDFRHSPSRPRIAPEPSGDDGPGVVIGRSPAMLEVSKLVQAAAASDLDVVLLGETGTGKEVISNLIHRLGQSTAKEPVAVNCAAIPAELLEAELFGIVKGAATGVSARDGVFIRADGGTLLLDEIGEMPLPLQAKLLRALQEREVMPVGGQRATPIDIRVISTTHRPLAQLVSEKKFRADLYYRLRGLEIRLPPLRERLEDLPEFATLFVQRFARDSGKRIRGISERALRILAGHSWPGNVRELETDMKRAVALCPNGGVVDSTLLAHLGVESGPSSPLPNQGSVPSSPSYGTLREELAATERERIRRELAVAEGNKSEAARQLGITWNGLVMKMKRLGLS